jgi:aromatic ring-opening dioxygenase catalytic subunit (LigB family)
VAQIIIGSCMSHSPLLAVTGDQWFERSNADICNPRLNLSDGRLVSYDALLKERGPQYADIATVEEFVRLSQAAQGALTRIGENIRSAKPDVVVIVGDDHYELFGPSNMPAISIFHGEKLKTLDKLASEALPVFMRAVGKGFAMDAVHIADGAPHFATALISGLIERKIDVGAAGRVDDPHRAGFGHAFGFVMKRILPAADIPIVPILLNTYYPPNVPTAERCYEFGTALREVIEAYPEDLRVAIIGSGGLSHFVVDEDLDRRVLSGFDPANAERLVSLPREALISGSSEILNWVVVAGAIAGLAERWMEYYPVYRTPAGTGIGLGFGIWGRSDMGASHNTRCDPSDESRQTHG